MKILYVTLSAIENNTSATIRNLALVDGFIRCGHQVEILTIPPTQNPEYFDAALIKNRQLTISYFTQSKVYEQLSKDSSSLIHKLKKPLFKGLRWLYHRISIYDYTIAIAKNCKITSCTKSHYDVLISSSDPKSSHVAAYQLLKQGLKVDRWIQYWGDPLAYDITNRVVYPRWMLKIIEKKWLKKANSIVYVSPFTLRQQRQHFKKHGHKMRFIPIGYTQAKWISPTSAKLYNLAYFGDYYKKVRNIKPLLQAIKSTDWTMVLAGSSDVAIKHPQITVFARSTQAKIAELENQSEISVVLLNRFGTQLPGKLFHYTASNQPVLVIVDGPYGDDMMAYIQSLNRFSCCRNNSDDIIEAIKKIRLNQKPILPNPYCHNEVIAKAFLQNI